MGYLSRAVKKSMENIFLALGSNVGDRQKNLEKAVELLTQNNVQVEQQSTVYETEPYGYKAQKWFFNQVIKVRSDLQALDLLRLCQRLEKEIGRQKTFKWGPRVIDIDILTFGDEIIDTPLLRVPHPLLQNRRFVLVPFNELAANHILAGLGKPVNELLNECIDTAIVRPL
jgi:2-amino-4-hydroxy-6-hydroxymethyldihydropteridine diphosphokinase